MVAGPRESNQTEAEPLETVPPRKRVNMTRIIDNTSKFPASLRSHLRECAFESGVDHLQYVSCEQADRLPDGRIVETWYDEDANCALFAWKAFVYGVGTKSGASRSEA